MATATLSRDGLLTLPREILDRLGWNRGDRVDLRVEEDGSVRLRARPHEATADAIDAYLDLCHGVYEGLSEEEVEEIGE